MFRFYYLINALSIDISLGAGVLSLVLGRYLGFRVPIPILLILVLTVWIIYTVDHLMDAKAIKHQATSFRHHLHQHYFKPLVFGLIAALTIVCFLLTQVPPLTVLFGVPISLGVAAYLVLNKFFGLTFQKEILIAVLYVAGVIVGPFSLKSGQLASEMWILLIQLVLMAWTNLLVFGIYELKEDRADSLKSTVTVWGIDKTGSLIKSLLILTFAIGLSGLVFHYTNAQFFKLQTIFLFMNGVLGILYFRKDNLSNHGLQYRYFGDGIFFMPVAFFWF